LTDLTEYGDVMLDGVDEWGFRKIDGLLEDGTTIIVVTVGVTYINVSDGGSGVDALYSLSATLTLVESGSGSDVPTMQANLPLTDSGTGTDVLQSIGIPISDNGAGTETLDMQAQLFLVDSGIGTEILGLSAQLTLADSGNGIDLIIMEAQVTLTETGVGIEIVNVTTGEMYINVSDSGLGVESFSSLCTITISDYAVGSDVARAACLIEAPQVIVTKDGKIILRISLATKDKPDYIMLG
jgi:hypothetical protein